MISLWLFPFPFFINLASHHLYISSPFVNLSPPFPLYRKKNTTKNKTHTQQYHYLYFPLLISVTVTMATGGNKRRRRIIFRITTHPELPDASLGREARYVKQGVLGRRLNENCSDLRGAKMF